MAFIGTTINDSPVIAGTATAAFTSAEFLAVKFDSDGGIVKADTAGENVLGLLPAEQGDIEAGNTVTVQIKECGLWKAGAAVAAGDELTTDANGKCTTAASGNFILAIALEAATAADEVIKVQIVKAGYKA
ncbi:MAG: DUF2190 family protein [Clostridia bacterium]|nr:DUF2190 family protein [Clostridia bacterium]